MGSSLASLGSGGRRGRRRKVFAPMSEINVTPFVDVMLVLLIIFMVAAPLLTVGVPIELPETRAKPLQGDNEPLTVSVKQDGRVFLQNSEVGLDTLTPKLVAIAKNGYEERIFVRADKAVGYGDVMKVMGELNRAGFRKIGLVTDSESVKLPQ
ncbi:MAG TPA: protein TolR [Aestuariivirgaceae bacterium]|jgi:biopolymer transport protein TolR|nr:protein TolR [Aestuariivirgaceae bacterium]